MAKFQSLIIFLTVCVISVMCSLRNKAFVENQEVDLLNVDQPHLYRCNRPVEPPRRFKAEPNSHRWIALRWRWQSEQCLKYYHLEYQAVDTVTNKTLFNKTRRISNSEVYHLEKTTIPCALAKFTLTAVGKRGRNASSYAETTTRETGPPSAPKNGKQDISEPTKISVTWEWSRDNSTTTGQSICHPTTFVAKIYDIDGKEVKRRVTVGPKVRHAQWEQLQPATRYNVRVWAIHRYRWSGSITVEATSKEE